MSMLRNTCYLVAALGLAACEGSHEQAAVREPAPYATVSSSQVQQVVENLPEPDRSFLRQAAGAHVAAIRFGQLAMTRGSTEKVRNIGSELVDTHTALNDELRSEAHAEGITLPMAQMTAYQQQEYARLQTLSGPAFDAEFVNTVQRIQNQTIASFNDEAVNGRDPAIRQLANESLPDLNNRVRFVRQEIQRM